MLCRFRDLRSSGFPSYGGKSLVFYPRVIRGRLVIMLSGTESFPVHWTTGLEWFAIPQAWFQCCTVPKSFPVHCHTVVKPNRSRISPSQTHSDNQAGQVPGPSLIRSSDSLWRLRRPSRRLPGIKPESPRIMQRNTGIQWPSRYRNAPSSD